MKCRTFIQTLAGGIAMLALARPALADAMSDAKAFVDKYASQVTTWDGPTSGPKAESGKSIVVLAADMKNGGILKVVDGIGEAAKAVGWKVTTLDGAGSIAGRTAAFGQAMALKPDGIIINGFDTVEQGPAMPMASPASSSSPTRPMPSPRPTR